MRWHVGIIAAVIVGLFIVSAQAADKQLNIFPHEINLNSKESRQTIIAQWQTGEEVNGQAVQGVSFASGDESVVRIEESQAIPVANGKATITAKADGQTTTAEVTV